MLSTSIVLFLVFAVQLAYGESYQRLKISYSPSSNNNSNYIASATNAYKHPLFCVEARFGPKHFETIQNIPLFYFNKIACSNDHSTAVTTQPFIAVVERVGCSYVHKTIQAQQHGAVALIVINDENTVGMLFPMFDDRRGLSNDIKIPAIIITREDGDQLKKDIIDRNLTLFAEIASEQNYSMQDGWGAYIYVYSTLNFITASLILCSIIIVFRIDRTAPVVRILLILAFLSATFGGIDIVWDHWSLRGVVPRVAVMITNSLAITSAVLEHSLNSWLWICVLNDKHNMKKKRLDLHPKFLVLFVGTPLLMDIIKLILIGAGVTILKSFLFYNTVLAVWFCICSMITAYNSWVCRKKAMKLIRGNDMQMKLIFYQSFISIFGFFGTCVSLLLWCSKPDVFGVWSWFGFHTYWRIATWLFNNFTLFFMTPKLPPKIMLKLLFCQQVDIESVLDRRRTHSNTSSDSDSSPTARSNRTTLAKTQNNSSRSTSVHEGDKDSEKTKGSRGSSMNTKEPAESSDVANADKIELQIIESTESIPQQGQETKDNSSLAERE